jgi:uncharacterized protein (TIGR02145 family)
MKKLLVKLTLIFLLATLLINCSAEKDSKKVAEVSTTAAGNITLLTATSGGNITDNGGADVTARGVVWNTATAPTTNLATKTTDGTGVGGFSSAMSNLSPSTSYFVRAYAINSVGIAYGNEITFTTGAIVLPTLTTTAVSGVTNNSATSGGIISSDGGATITAKGVCWGTSPSPTIVLTTRTNNGTGTATFNTNIGGFSPSTTYYVRAYATNSSGTAYGQERVFTTLSTLPILTTTVVSAITTTTASSGGTISSDGGATITEKGVCWSKSPSPTIALATRTNSGGIGMAAFTSSISGLSSSNNYYVRAYATNSVGTAYGNELIFSSLQNTNAASLPNVTIGTQIWQSINLKLTTYRDGTPIPQVTDPTAWANLTTGAWCYYNNDPTNGSDYGNYGKLYNWYAVAGIYDAASLANPSLRKQLAPTGWHIPTDEEWTTLTSFLGGINIAGGKMKDTYSWATPNTGATNSSGFSGLAGGYRSDNGHFQDIGAIGWWWSSSTYNVLTYNNLSVPVVRIRYLNYINRIVTIQGMHYPYGFSVRCIRD